MIPTAPSALRLSPPAMARFRAELYGRLKVLFADSPPFAFTSWDLTTTGLAAYDPQARILLDTKDMDGVSSWADFFTIVNVVRADTREQGTLSRGASSNEIVHTSLMRAASVRDSFLQGLLQNAELYLTIITKVGRIKVPSRELKF